MFACVHVRVCACVSAYTEKRLGQTEDEREGGLDHVDSLASGSSVQA